MIKPTLADFTGVRGLGSQFRHDELTNVTITVKKPEAHHPVIMGNVSGGIEPVRLPHDWRWRRAGEDKYDPPFQQFKD